MFIIVYIDFKIKIIDTYLSHIHTSDLDFNKPAADTVDILARRLALHVIYRAVSYIFFYYIVSTVDEELTVYSSFYETKRNKNNHLNCK